MKKLILFLLLITIFLVIGGIFTFRSFLGGPGVEELRRKYSKEEFCGWSTDYKCSVKADCVAGGCSGHVCGGINEELITTCEWTECYDAKAYNVECKCVDSKCQWS